MSEIIIDVSNDEFLRKVWLDELKETRDSNNGIGILINEAYDQVAAETLMNYSKSTMAETLRSVYELCKDSHIKSLEDLSKILVGTICELVNIDKCTETKDMYEQKDTI